MNTRLQVEHPVTEMVYGVDLVAAQVRTAAGEGRWGSTPPTLCPAGPRRRGADLRRGPGPGVPPQTGSVLRLRIPHRPGLRVDAGLAEGREVGLYYDPLLAKVIAWGEDRATATVRLHAALGGLAVLGVTTNVDFLMDVLALPAWRSGDLHTGFLDEHLPAWRGPEEPPPEVVALAAAASIRPEAGSGDGRGALPTPWTTVGNWSPLGGR